jgi:hypothetical protein
MKITVHRFTMGDVEDPDLYAAQPIWEWEQSEAGQWVMTNATETPTWHRGINHMTYGYCYEIRAQLKDQDVTFFKLKWA